MYQHDGAKAPRNLLDSLLKNSNWVELISTPYWRKCFIVGTISGICPPHIYFIEKIFPMSLNNHFVLYCLPLVNWIKNGSPPLAQSIHWLSSYNQSIPPISGSRNTGHLVSGTHAGKPCDLEVGAICIPKYQEVKEWRREIGRDRESYISIFRLWFLKMYIYNKFSLTNINLSFYSM